MINNGGDKGALEKIRETACEAIAEFVPRRNDPWWLLAVLADIARTADRAVLDAEEQKAPLPGPS